MSVKLPFQYVFNNVREHSYSYQLIMGSNKPRKVLLGVIFLLQVLIIGGFWLLQVSYHTSVLENTLKPQPHPLTLQQYNLSRVNFIQKIYKYSTTQNLFKYIKPTNENAFHADFQQLETNTTEIWCFRIGTKLTQSFNRCICKPLWHGRDCAQPEVIWRALMTKRQALQIREQPTRTPLRLAYIIEGNILNSWLLELQIETVQQVVDLFIIINTNNNAQLHELDALKKQLQNNLKHTKFLLYQCGISTCHETLPLVQLTTYDACIYSDDHTLLSPQSLTFAKYYAEKLYAPIWRFRLKHNVYGFYWQHPKLSRTDGQLTDCAQFSSIWQAKRTLQKSEPDQGFVIGDLNHFGGWYCDYCQQPKEIIAELLLEQAQTNRTKKFQQGNMNLSLQTAALQQLITQGIYVDGKTQLLKLRRYADKYYAPYMAINNTAGKYSDLLVNMFESFGDDLLEDDYANWF